jgi:hypothetical protein
MTMKKAMLMEDKEMKLKEQEERVTVLGDKRSCCC